MRVNQFKDRVDELLAQGILDFSMTLGVLARIDGDSYEIVAVQSNSGAYVPGEKYALGDSLSQQVCKQRKTIAEIDIDYTASSPPHPLYRSLPLECYIGAPIILADEVWGCVDFSSMAQRDQAFTETDMKLVEEIAAGIASLIVESE